MFYLFILCYFLAEQQLTVRNVARWRNIKGWSRSWGETGSGRVYRKTFAGPNIQLGSINSPTLVLHQSDSTAVSR